MLTPTSVAPWVRSPAFEKDWIATKELKDLLAGAIARRPARLTHDEFDRVLDWKLENQRPRVERLLKFNTPEVIEEVTRFALNVRHPDFAYETSLRLAGLSALRGVNIGVASAVLALCFPAQHAVIDFRGWHQAFGEDRRQFSVGQYLSYLDAIRPLATKLRITVQEVDFALWCRDRSGGVPATTLGKGL